MHSPGPWKWGENRDKERRLVDANGNSVIAVDWESGRGYGFGDKHHVEVYNDHDSRLIAAAPRMLELLRSVPSALSTWSRRDTLERAVEKLLAELDE